MSFSFRLFLTLIFAEPYINIYALYLATKDKIFARAQNINETNSFLKDRTK